ncbi:MAG TPA: hypothetical protein VG734_26850 [Lacunisphaera sp.]|nr:hypothetical protein [Lacunisphaera sp.]
MVLPARRDGRRGSVVIYVLGIILLASFLITRLMDRAAVELAAESKATKRADLRQEALSALEASLAVLADESAARSGLHDPAEGWDRPLALFEYQPAEGFAADVLVEDETGKLSLPTSDEEALGAYLTAIGCPATAQDKLVDALLVWTKPDYASLEDSDAGAFSGAALPYEAPQRALRSFAELRAIPAARDLFFDENGEWNDLGRRFQAGASLFAFNASNVNSAPPEVLLARGVDEGRVAAIRAARQDRNTRSPFYRSAAELAGAMGRDAAPPGLGTDAQCLHVIVTVAAGARFCRLDAWVRPAGTGAAPAASPRRQNPESQPSTPPVASVRNNPRKRLDYPFQILELRENDGT